MLARDVIEAAERRGHEVDAPNRAEMDITDPTAIDEALEDFRPDAVINCAAWSDVDGAEDDERGAMRVNDTGAALLAAGAARIGASVLYPSSDYVFDGTKRTPYLEEDMPNPISAYGRSKLGGEVSVAAANPKHFIVRTSWLYGLGGGNFVETMLRLGQGGGPVVVVHDQVGCPTYTGHLAEGLMRMIDTESYGIHHLAGNGSCSWYEFAMEIFRQSEVVTRVMASTTDMMERPAKRPANSVLASARTTPLVLPDWQRGLGAYLERRQAPTTEEAKPERRAGSTAFRQPVLDLHSDLDEETSEEPGDPGEPPTPEAPPEDDR